MQRPLRKLCAMTVSLAAALSLGACDPTPASLKKPNMTTLSARLQPLFEKTRTVCFGRLVMDVPATATVVFGPAQVPSRIERLPGEGDKLASWVSRRENELRAEERKPTGSGQPLYKETLDGTMPGQKIVIGWESFSDPFYKVESFVKLGPDLYVQEAQADPKEDELTKEFGGSLPEELALLNDIARNLRARAEEEIPSDPGVCIDGAFIAGELDQKFETIALGVRLKEFPDVHFSIDTRKMDVASDEPESVSMERRLKEAERDADRSGHGAWYARIKFLRRGERDVNGLKGYEVAAHKPAHDGLRDNHQFLYCSAGEPGNAFKPSLDIQLDTGVDDNKTGGVTPSLTDEEAVAVWDKLTGSIRVRPTTVAKTSEAAPLLPLGSLAATGRTCEQSGLWECDEQRAADDQRHRFIREGQVMPSTVVTGEASGLWGRLRGERTVQRVATMWKLIGYGEPPPSDTAPHAQAISPPAADAPQDPPPRS